MSTIYQVQLTRCTYGGEAFGRLPDGRAVFVPFALPEETARIRLVEDKPGYARAELLEIVTPSPQRISPRCAHFGLCGGCHYQHMPYELQLQTKTAILGEQLERIGKLKNPPVAPAIASPLPYHYRNHIQFDLTPEGKLGYHTALTDQVFAIQECHLPQQPLHQLWQMIDIEPFPGLQGVHLRLGMNDEAMLILVCDEPQLPQFQVEGLPISAVHLSPAGRQVLVGNEYLMMEVLGRLFRVSADSFFQVNTPMAAAMVEHVLRLLDLTRADTALEVYAGVGLFSAFLAPKVGRLIAIEASASACDDFAFNLDEYDNVELYQATAEETLPRLEVHPKAILVDPPRSGIARKAMQGILGLKPQQLVYISCDPATLARDARYLAAGGYRLVQITPFDLFPQTYHIESISLWERVA